MNVEVVLGGDGVCGWKGKMVGGGIWMLLSLSLLAEVLVRPSGLYEVGRLEWNSRTTRSKHPLFQSEEIGGRAAERFHQVSD